VPPETEMMCSTPAGPHVAGVTFDENGNIIYLDSGAGGGQGCVWSISPHGDVNWCIPEAGNYMWGAPVVGVGGKLYVATAKWDEQMPGENALLTIDAETGAILESVPLGYATDHYPSIHPSGEYLILRVGPRFHCYQIDPEGMLHFAWDHGITQPSTSYGAQPLVYDEYGNTVMYLSTRSNDPGRRNLHAYLVEPMSATELWSTPIGDAVSQPVVGRDGTIYCSTLDTLGGDTLFAVRPDGSMKWSVDTGGSHTGPPSVGPDGTIYLGSRNGKVIAISDAYDGAHIKWTFETGDNYEVCACVMASDDGIVYVGSRNGHLYALRDRHTEPEVLWDYNLGDGIDATAAVGPDGCMYVATRGGMNPNEAFLYRLKPVAVSETPEGWINPGWNWVSIPIDPFDPNAGSIFGWDNVYNKLLRWNPVQKNLELFPDDFTDVEIGRGYTLRADVDLGAAVDGYVSVLPFEIKIPEAGWQWIGHPSRWAVPLKGCAIRDDDTADVRTAVMDAQDADPWVNWNLIYWNSAYDTASILCFAGGDDNMLRAWYGYRLWANRRNLTLLVPTE
jgi:outer membrane protein assembly factor BamB